MGYNGAFPYKRLVRTFPIKIIKYKFHNPVDTFSTRISYIDGVGIMRNMVAEALQNESGILIFLPPRELATEHA